jgi:de-etiolated-1
MDSFVTGFSSNKLDRSTYDESDKTGSLRFLPRTIPSQNLAARLRARETFGTSFCRANARINTSRGFYTNIYPNYTMVNVEKPPCFLRKFSPDGKRFIAFSQCQTHLEVYEYLGPAAGGELMEFFDSNVNDCPTDFLPNEETWFTARVRSKAFDTYFSLEHYIPLTSVGGEQLNRECSLFSEDGDFVIVGSASYVPDDHHPSMWELRQNNESVTPNSRNPLEDYTLYSIEIAEGLLIDKITFKTDKIFLSHNQGLYLYKDTLAILSVQHQTIHVYKYVYGKFIEVVKIGRVLYEDDVYFLSTVLTADQQTSLPGNFVYRECREQTINMVSVHLVGLYF